LNTRFLVTWPPTAESVRFIISLEISNNEVWTIFSLHFWEEILRSIVSGIAVAGDGVLRSPLGTAANLYTTTSTSLTYYDDLHLNRSNFIFGVGAILLNYAPSAIRFALLIVFTGSFFLRP
jgi:hypothetical protein